jgi:hypothetical protein
MVGTTGHDGVEKRGRRERSRGYFGDTGIGRDYTHCLGGGGIGRSRRRRRFILRQGKQRLLALA